MNNVSDRVCHVEEASGGATWGCSRCGAQSGLLPSRGAARVAADAHRCPDEPVRVSRDGAHGRWRRLRAHRH